MRLHILGWLVLVLGLTDGYSALQAATATPRPTPTIKACHICEEEEFLPATATPSAAQGRVEATPGPDRPVVRAVMFWMSTCPHCHEVIDHVLPPLQEKYGEQLEILLIEVTSEREWNWLVQAGESFGIPQDRLGVPFLVIGDRALLGSQQIPAELPGLIEQHLAAGGVDYSDVSGLTEALPTATPTVTPSAIHLTSEHQAPVVQVVMFWVNGCPHCHELIDNVLPPLKDKYWDQLDIELVEITSTQRVDHLYQTAAALGIPRERVGVPFLVIGDAALIGSAQISGKLPELIEQYLAAGGVGYPDMPGLAEALSTATSDPETCSPATPCADETPQVQANGTSTAAAGLIESQPPMADSDLPSRPHGFGLAIGIMVGIVAALLYAGVTIARGPQGNPSLQVPPWLSLAIPILALVGLGVAGYLAYVETQAVSAVCGPVGDCNVVQSSPYAKLFGVLPVGVLGAVGYVLILAAWLWGRLRSDRLADYAPLAILGMALVGVLFSLYLTYLEPFVIRAVCAWCLSSAVIITLLMLLSLRPALQAVEVRHEP